VRIVAALALFAVAAVCALLAGDVRGWGDALPDGTPSTRVPFDAGARLLGVRDDVAYARALALYRAAAALPIRLDNADAVAAAHNRAQRALAEVARTTHDPRRAAQAETLSGVLSFAELAQPVGVTGIKPEGIGRSQADAALAAFTTAVRENPDDVTAKFDLELLLRALLVQGTRIGAASQAGASTGRHGAGGGQPGSGY
jgi:hypothetical protein